jgi:hypothetical protein
LLSTLIGVKKVSGIMKSSAKVGLLNNNQTIAMQYHVDFLKRGYAFHGNNLVSTKGSVELLTQASSDSYQSSTQEAVTNYGVRVSGRVRSCGF